MDRQRRGVELWSTGSASQEVDTRPFRGLGWVSARAKGGATRPVRPYLTGSTGFHLGCLASQPPRLLTPPPPPPQQTSQRCR